MDETIQKTLAELDKINQQTAAATSGVSVPDPAPLSIPLPSLPPPPPSAAAQTAKKGADTAKPVPTAAPSTELTPAAAAGKTEAVTSEKAKVEDTVVAAVIKEDIDDKPDSPGSPFFYGEVKYSSSEPKLNIDLVSERNE